MNGTNNRKAPAMSTNGNSTILDSRFWNENQAWCFTQIVRTPAGTRLQVRIRRNAYDNQSYAVVERWDGTAWQQVANRPISQCASARYSYVRDEDDDLAREDAASLILLACAVVEP